jgi:putative transposase
MFEGFKVGAAELNTRQQAYAHMRLPERSIPRLEAMASTSGKRKVGSAALTNVRVSHASVKNYTSRVLESHTCELIFAYELELDPDVLGYQVQVPCRGVQRITSLGRKHVSNAHLDFLVFRRETVELVECKTRAWIEERAKIDQGWELSGDQWTYLPYENWAKQLGIPFSVWSPPQPSGVYQQNLEACYSLHRSQLDPLGRLAASRASDLLRGSTRSINELCRLIEGFSYRVALWMLANGEAFGPWMSTPISLGDRFHLHLDRGHARAEDTNLLQHAWIYMQQPETVDPLSSASPTDRRKAGERLARLEQMAVGTLKWTRRMQDLATHVDREVAKGGSALAACLTRYSKSGNRVSRLHLEQEQAIEDIVRDFWLPGKVRSADELYQRFLDECESRGIEPCGRWRLDKRRREQNPLRHALSTGGFRAYHALRPSTDPRMRSLPPLGYGQVLHVDSSDLDVRCAPNLMNGMPAIKAKFYIGIDGATGDTMAHSLIFGAARTDGLALLIREYVRRHGMLPRMIHLDRGSENTSRWLKEFAEGRISLRHSPTAASAWNGLAENAIKQVNDQVAHKLDGSTAPDQKGRKVDGRFKSYSNARTSFVMILNHFVSYVYGDLPSTPRSDGFSPIEKRRESIAMFGKLGSTCEFNDDLLIRTSVHVSRRLKPDPRRGIRTADGWFSSDELLLHMRGHAVEEVRSDCCDPSILHVKIGDRWIRAFHNRVQSMAMLSDSERLFELLYAPTRRRDARKKREDLGRRRHTRMQNAIFAMPAVEHLKPESEEQTLPQDTFTEKTSLDSYAEVLPFEERENF